MATPLLVDTDPGIDDALALLAAWSSPEVVVEVVTTVAGNVTVEQATTNVCRLLALRKPDPAPVVAIGAPDPLARQLVTATRYHGADGLGDLDDWPAVGRGELAAAVPLILDRARRQQRLLTIVALGPMTNLALALKADPAAMKFVGRVVAMGGAVDVPGNVTPTAEFNMYVDPEAAHRVLAAGLSLDLVPLDATRQAVLPRAGLKKALSRRAWCCTTRWRSRSRSIRRSPSGRRCGSRSGPRARPGARAATRTAASPRRSTRRGSSACSSIGYARRPAAARPRSRLRQRGLHGRGGAAAAPG